MEEPGKGTCVWDGGIFYWNLIKSFRNFCAYRPGAANGQQFKLGVAGMLHWRGSAQAPLCVSEADGGIAFLRRAVQYVGDAMQSLRHGFAVPPPFAQGRLWLSANRICSVNPNFSQTSAAPKASPVQGEVGPLRRGALGGRSRASTSHQQTPISRFAAETLTTRRNGGNHMKHKQTLRRGLSVLLSLVLCLTLLPMTVLAEDAPVTSNSSARFD